ncbi:ATP-binding protein [Gorillibacterium sp. sgz5001074]|uniref:sensor histidine kinase n=1 Tax=Gorillibacterium sp. sgz5001074 TaxID=3446695 RepID=UPI003F6728BE
MIPSSHTKLLLIRIVFLLLAAILWGPTVPASAAREELSGISQGLLDLSAPTDSSPSRVSLDGLWEFHWGQLLEPRELSHAAADPAAYIQVPGIWGPGNPSAPERHGYGTYRLQIRFSDAESGHLKSIYIRNAATAYRIWVNGVELGGNGTVGTSLHDMIPKNYAKVFTFPVRPEFNEVVIQVSNYVQRKGGLWSSIQLGDPLAIADQRDANAASQLFIGSALFMMGLYHLAVFLLRRNKLAVLTGGACFLVCIRSLLLGDTLLVRLFPGIGWEWGVKFEYWGVYLCVSMFALFVRELFPLETNRVVIGIQCGISAGIALFVLLFPARVFTLGILVFEVFLVASALYLFYTIILAVREKRVGSKLCLFGGLVIIVTVVHDVLYYNHYIAGIDLAPYGVLAFFFAQTLVVALKFVKAYAEVERLSGALSEINLKLEEKIGERTRALEVSNSYLVYANEHLNRVENSRRELIANITHELGTPMTSIQGYMKAFLDGVVQPEKQYIRIIYDKIQLAERLVQDLFDLTKLEEGQTSFHMVDVIVEELFMDQFSKFRWDVEEMGIRFVMKQPESPEDMLAIVRIDPIRIRQVLNNLIGNALNYTMEGGTITLAGEYSGDRLILSVSDTGKGIAPSVLPHIFDRFVKDSGPRRNAKGGSGLGLAIAKEIVLHHGGNMSVTSEPGKGSTFFFDLPVEFIPMVVD